MVVFGILRSCAVTRFAVICGMCEIVVMVLSCDCVFIIVIIVLMVLVIVRIMVIVDDVVLGVGVSIYGCFEKSSARVVIVLECF